VYKKVEQPESPSEFKVAPALEYVKKPVVMTVTDFKKHTNIAYKTSNARMTMLL
jgi:hypothetical protein